MNQALNFVQRETSANRFEDNDWIKLCHIVEKTFHFTPELNHKLENSKLMKLIAGLPYLAGCRNPERIGLSHLAITILAGTPAGKASFLHKFNDNDQLMNRLERISHFPDGNKDIIDRGMNLIALVMINDHIQDVEMDKKSGKYNPVSSGMWNAEKIKRKLTNEINEFDCPEMDDILRVYETKNIFWENWATIFC